MDLICVAINLKLFLNASKQLFKVLLMVITYDMECFYVYSHAVDRTLPSNSFCHCTIDHCTTDARAH